jgi:thymidylate synthase
MSANVSGWNINQVFVDSLKYLTEHGDTLTIRGSEVKEVTNFTYELKNIHNNILTIPYRFNNFPAVCYETMWVISGMNNLSHLKYFLPNCVDYSDNGKTWAGAYGPRLRYGCSSRFRYEDVSKPINHINYKDQLYHVMRTLRDDPYSRQAMIIIGSSADYESDQETKDRPCNIAIQYYIRNNELNCTVFQRSGDAVWGTFNINIFEWTTIQKIIADCLNVATGSLTHHITSFHHYTDKHTAMIEKVLETQDEIPDIYEHYRQGTDQRDNGDESEFHKILEYHYANVFYSLNVLDHLIDNDVVRKQFNEIDKLFIDIDNQGYIKNLHNTAKSFILLKKGYIHPDFIQELLTDRGVYSIAILEYIVRYFKDDPKQIEGILDEIDDSKYEAEIIDYIKWSL